MAAKKIYNLLNYVTAFVWIGNGLFCKLMSLVPRHQQIVSRILGNEYAPILTKGIGLMEILMAIWVLSRVCSRVNTIMQMLVVAVMNIIEYITVPDLLLFGKFNILVALAFILMLYYKEFVLKTQIASPV